MASEKIIRDPVHDVIAFRLDHPAEGLLFRLINADEFQRLRRIRQLGLASLAYPGAEHTRYSHSLGVMETARKMICQLRRSFQIDEGDETVCLCASLLHDLGHGPFSHVFERVSGVHHEAHTRTLVEDPDSQVHQLLAAHDPTMPRRVLDMLAGNPPKPFLGDILSSQLDADRFDYLLRDNLMTGSGYGDYDLEWLLHALTIDPDTNRLAVTWKGISAVEAYLQSRYHMYRNVYFHKVVRAAEGMVRLALQRVKRLAVQDRLPWPPRGHVVIKALTGQALTTAEFADLDDVSVLHCFKEWTSVDDRPLAALCRGILFRDVFRTIDLTGLPDEEVNRVITTAEQTAVNAGADARYAMFLDEPSDIPYEPSEILVRYPDGTRKPFTEVSPITQALAKHLIFRRLHVAPSLTTAVRQAIAGAH